MAGPLKIGLVLDDSLDKPDGVQQYVLSIGSWLTAQGHAVHYLVGKTTRTDIANVHSLSRNLSVQFNGNGMSIPLPTSRRTLRALLRAERFDVLHIQVPYSPWLAGRIITAADKRTAVVGTFHIAPYSKLVTAATWLLGHYCAPTLRRFNTIVSVSSAAQRFARQTYGVSTQVIPNAFDYQKFHDAAPIDRYDGLTVLFLGRLVPRKGCMVLLQAVQQLRSTHPALKFRVLICGKGPERAALESFVRSSELAAYVTFVGFVSETDKPRYLAAADLAVFPSSAGESFGIVLLEAMANGRTAVLGGDNSGYRSVLEPRAELLFPPSDVTGLAEKMAVYLTDTEARVAAASWGSTYAQRYDMPTVGQEILQVYRSALHKRC